MSREATRRRRGDRHQTVLVWLTEPQHRTLKAAAAARGTSMGGLVHQGLALLFDEHNDTSKELTDAQ